MKNPAVRIVVESAVFLAGLAILASVFSLDQTWIDRHSTQAYFWPQTMPNAVWYLRAAGVAVGAVLMVWVRARLGRWTQAVSARWLASASWRLLLSVICSLLVVEAYLRWPKNRLVHELLGEPHSRYGWIWKRSTETSAFIAGRHVHFASDSEGIRVPDLLHRPDVDRPTLLFTGESFVAGHGLEYEETFPALVATHLGLQSVNLAVNGYGSDQAFLRLVDALPRYRKVVAVVCLFVPRQLARNLQDIKPHFFLAPDGTLKLLPATTSPFARLRVYNLLRSDLPWMTDRTLATTMQLTSALAREMADRVRSRGAKILFVIPSFGPRRSTVDHPEYWMAERLFQRQQLPYIFVDLDGNVSFPRDRHPSPRGAQLIAAEVERALSPLPLGAED